MTKATGSDLLFPSISSLIELWHILQCMLVLLISNLVTFVLGFLSGWLLEVRQENRKAFADLARDVYTPIRAQAFKTRGNVEAREQADTVDFGLWQSLETTGRVNEIPWDLRRELKEFFETIMPNYRSSWVTAQVAKDHLLESWDNTFGVMNVAQTRAPMQSWWPFLVQEGFISESIPRPSPSAPVRLWNRELDLSRVAKQAIAFDQFLEKCWKEAQAHPDISKYQRARNDARAAVVRLLRHLDRTLGYNKGDL